MEITGLEARHSDLARGILIARSSRLLTAAEQAALWAALAAAGVTEQADEDTEDEPDRQRALALLLGKVGVVLVLGALASDVAVGIDPVADGVGDLG